MDIDPRRLPFLLSVAREGGIVAAADILMVSPSAVSQQIQKLEEEVGLRLVERTTSGAILTPAGSIVAEAGERINADIEEALNPTSPGLANIICKRMDKRMMGFADKHGMNSTSTSLPLPK